MVLTRSMMKSQGLRPVVLQPLSVSPSKHVLSFKEMKEQPVVQTTVQPVPRPLINQSNWPYYAMFVPAFMYCAYYRSASGIVWVSLLSQMVHYMVTK
jgi:hypothetical protein